MKQTRYPEPRKGSECYLQAAGPVDSNRKRILLLPVIPLLEKFQSKLRALRQTIRFGQRDQVLVPVQIPNNLRVADLAKIEIWNVVPSALRSASPVYSI